MRICLPMQGTWVPSLVWEDSTCCRAVKPRHHNLLKPARLKPVLHNKRSRHNDKPVKLESSPRSPQLKKAHEQHKDPVHPKINKSLKIHGI